VAPTNPSTSARVWPPDRRPCSSEIASSSSAFLARREAISDSSSTTRSPLATTLVYMRSRGRWWMVQPSQGPLTSYDDAPTLRLLADRVGLPAVHWQKCAVSFLTPGHIARVMPNCRMPASYSALRWQFKQLLPRSPECISETAPISKYVSIEEPHSAKLRVRTDSRCRVLPDVPQVNLAALVRLIELQPLLLRDIPPSSPRTTPRRIVSNACGSASR
jgi:hypothetical protein